MAEALGETIVAGPKTNVAFLKKLCEAEEFRAGQFDTGFIDRNLEALGAAPQPRRRRVLHRFGVAELSICSAKIERIAVEPSPQTGDELVGRPWTASLTASSCCGSAGSEIPSGASMANGIDVPLEMASRRHRGQMLRRRYAADGSRASKRRSTIATSRRRRTGVTSSAADHGVYVLRNGRQTRVAGLRSLRRRSRAHGRGRLGQGADARQADRRVRAAGRQGREGAAARRRRGDEDGACARRALPMARWRRSPPSRARRWRKARG